MPGSIESTPQENAPGEESAAPSAEQAAHSWPYEIETFSGDRRRDEQIGARKMAVDNQFRLPLHLDLLGDVDQRLVEKLKPHLGENETETAFDPATYENYKTLPPDPETKEEQALLELSNELRGAGAEKPKSLDTVFAELDRLDVPAKKTRLNALLTFAEGLRQQALVEKGDKILLRVAEVIHLRAQIVTTELFMSNEIYPTAHKQDVAQTYSVEFGGYAQTDDIPDRFKEQLVEAAERLEQSEYAKKAETTGDEEQTVEVRREEPAVPEDAVASPESRVSSKFPEELVLTEEPLTFEYTPGKKLFGRERGITAEDVLGIQHQLELAVQEDSPQRAYEVAQLLFRAERAGIRLTGGEEQIRHYLEGQREAMQKHGPRVLAQYLTYGKRLGLLDPVSPQEEQILMAGINQRLQDPTAQHTGLTRLAMNARYLRVGGYTPELVRQGVIAEIEWLKSHGQSGEAVVEIARAQQAGVSIQETLPDRGVNMQKALSEVLSSYKADRAWDEYARLRNVMEKIGVAGIFPEAENTADRMARYFRTMRLSTSGGYDWEAYLRYAADVQQISDRKIVPPPEPVALAKPQPLSDEVQAERAEKARQNMIWDVSPPGVVQKDKQKVAQAVIDNSAWKAEELEDEVKASWLGRTWERLFGEQQPSGLPPEQAEILNNLRQKGEESEESPTNREA